MQSRCLYALPNANLMHNGAFPWLDPTFQKQFATCLPMRKFRIFPPFYLTSSTCCTRKTSGQYSVKVIFYELFVRRFNCRYLQHNVQYVFFIILPVEYRDITAFKASGFLKATCRPLNPPQDLPYMPTFPLLQDCADTHPRGKSRTVFHI